MFKVAKLFREHAHVNICTRVDDNLGIYTFKLIERMERLMARFSQLAYFVHYHFDGF